MYDYAIIGAGCAGLSLAVELIHSVPVGKRIALIDPRQDYYMDRLWCFWKTSSHRFSNAIEHQWYRWKVCHNGQEVVHASSKFPYQYLPAELFYTEALEAINRYNWVDLMLSTSAIDLSENENSVTVVTNRGDIEAALVFEGRNDHAALSKMDCLLQHYVGQRVRTTKPVFDPDTVTLMDFNVSQHHGITFIYVLPFSEREALVEPTIFSNEPLNNEVYEQLIQDYLRNQLNLYHYEVVFQEKGIIPMTVDIVPPKSFKRIIPIGTSAGMVRASTGYGFLTIQKWSKILVDYIFGKQHKCLPKPYSNLSMFLDRIFLSYLKRHPLSTPAMFYDLFRKVTPERLVRFLSDQANMADLGAVILSMPMLPFMGEAYRVVYQKEWTHDR